MRQPNPVQLSFALVDVNVSLDLPLLEVLLEDLLQENSLLWFVEDVSDDWSRIAVIAPERVLLGCVLLDRDASGAVSSEL